MSRRVIVPLGADAPADPELSLFGFPDGFYVGPMGFYMKDTATGLYTGFRLTNGEMVKSTTQSSTPGFDF